MALLRVRTAAARHALWTCVLLGMLLVAAASWFAPPIPWRILGSQTAVTGYAAAPSAPVSVTYSGAAMPASAPSWHWPTVNETITAVYFAVVIVLLIRLSFGYLFTRRLVRASRRTELGSEAIYESSWISVPLTVGWIRPKILLPAEWRGWDRDKLAAVLAHERTHVRRGDWGIALAAGINRCFFWFHPLAWWLERQLAALAEHACDDSALLEMRSREPYAQALLDMAAAVKTARGRLVWEAMAMAKASEVKMRVERILDETRQIPRGVSRRRWALLAACSLPLIYLAAAVQFAPAQVQEQTKTGTQAPARGVSTLTPADATRLEQQLVSNPDDLETRSKLIAYYFMENIREPRLGHILWMIQNHPESELTAMNSSGISPLPNSLNSNSDYQTAASTWLQQAAIHPKDSKVLANAAQFFAQPGGDWSEAERLLKQSGDTGRLAAFYNKVLSVSIDSSGVVHFPAQDENSAFASTVIAELESSTDPMFLANAGNLLRSLPQLKDGQMNGQAEKAFQPRVELGNRLLAKAEQLGGPKFAAQLPVMRVQPNAASATLPAPAKPVELAQPPQTISKAAPEYPPMAYNARIEGDVGFTVTIGTDGRVRDLVVTRAAAALGRSAMAAVWSWRFAPVIQNGVPVAAKFPLVVSYRLSGGDVPPPAEPASTSTGETPRTATATEPPPPTPSRIRVGGNVQAHMLINSVPPVYPEQARTAGANGEPLEGTVKLSIVIGKDGTVQTVTPVEGHPMLVAAAEAAVQQWTYRGTLLNGNPVEVSTTVDVNFTAK